MKLRKIMAGIAAAAVASSSLAVAASADFVIPENVDAGCHIGTTQWLVQVYNVGNAEENKPAVDYGIDLSKVDGIRFVIEGDLDSEDYGELWGDFFEGGIGGGVILSCNGGDIVKYEDPTDPFATESEVYGTYNWPAKYFWGMEMGTDEDGNVISTNPNHDEDPENDKELSLEKIGDYKWEVVSTGLANPLSNTEDAWDIKEIGCMQVCLDITGSSDIVPFNVVGCEILDAAGNVMVSFDAQGVATVGSTSAPADPEPEAPADPEPEAPADPEPEAPADPEPEAPAAPEAPGASSKPNVGTGAEGLALVAGIAVVATGAIVVAKKRS